MPRVGQLPEPHGGGAKDLDGATDALKLESCFFSFFEPQFGQAGWREPVTSSSATSLQEEQMYSNRAWGGLFRGGEGVDEHVGLAQADEFVDFPAILEDDEIGDGVDAELHGQFAVFIDIDLADLDGGHFSATCSRMGICMRQGPHHGAQKSTSATPEEMKSVKVC
jgi:hypothetical protein